MPSNPKPLPKIILASTSSFRASLLAKLHIAFETASPNINEAHLDEESVSQMVNRLSLEKGLAIAKQHPNSIIIASDQSAMLNNYSLGKPLNYQNAVKQLNECSGKCIEFYTGLAVIDTRKMPAETYQAHDITLVCFRTLSPSTIHNYLTLEEPYQCTGSFKSEGLGITLFSKIETTDPNALIGLPLIELTTILIKLGIPLPYLKTGLELNA